MKRIVNSCRTIIKSAALFTLVTVLSVAALGIPAPKASAASGAIWPTAGTVTGYYQWRCNSGTDSDHWGYDIGNPTGTPVYATQDGSLTSKAQRNSSGALVGYGLYIDITHANGWLSRYAHLSNNAVRTNGNVRQGELIGYMGSTGGSTGPHLHFEMRLNGSPRNFNSAAGCQASIKAKDPINYTFTNLVSTTREIQVANVNGCGALHIKRTFWGKWDQHMGCGQAKSVAMSPDGNVIAIIRPDNTLVAKDSYWGGWAQHTNIGDSQDVAVGNNGTIASVNGCGAVYVKRSYWGSWDQHMGCGQAKGISISGNGETIVVTRPDNTLVAKNSYWGNWAQHTNVGDSKDSAVSSNDTIAAVNGCGAVHVKQSYWGGWTQHMGCNQAKSIAVSPDGTSFAVVRPDNTLVAKQSLWGDWAQHVPVGDSKSAALSIR